MFSQSKPPTTATNPNNAPTYFSAATISAAPVDGVVLAAELAAPPAPLVLDVPVVAAEVAAVERAVAAPPLLVDAAPPRDALPISLTIVNGPCPRLVAQQPR